MALAAGTRLGPYEILAPIGAGGMGEVYRATDTRLDRVVAVKVIGRQYSARPDARARLEREARAVSRLNHPHICTLYDIGQEGDLDFLVLEYLKGATLAEHLQRGRLGVAQIVEYAIEAADALAAAHAMGIVHRDIKPGNVFVTDDGIVKLLDFGLARLSPASQAGSAAKGEEAQTATMTADLTGPGVVLGTLAYMSPEQAAGGEADAASDLFSFGAVLYEMATGARPFEASTSSGLRQAILRKTPQRASAVNPAIPAELDRIIARCMEKEPADRYPSAAQLLEDLRGVRRLLAIRPGRTRMLAAAVVVLAVVVAEGGWWIRQNSRVRWAEQQALPRAMQLADAEDFFPAFALVRDAEKIMPANPILASTWKRVSRTVRIESEPAGADVYRKPYEDVKGAWEYLGRTPLHNIRIARGYGRWKVTKDGYEPIEEGGDEAESTPAIVTADSGAQPHPISFALAKAGGYPEGMIRVGGGSTLLQIPGLEGIPPIGIPDYLIDRCEVTNRQYKKFVDSGGYEQPGYWKQEFLKDGRVLPRSEAMTYLRDSTGRPGPATWELSNYPAGQDEYPVMGISWYEAAAYAEFVHKKLPTAYHWSRAAGTRMSPWIIPLSNFSGRSATRCEACQAVSPWGAKDMAGNAKEWCWNASGKGRLILGGGYNEPPYMFNDWDARPPLDRSNDFGFRLMQLVPGKEAPAAAEQPVPTAYRDYRKEKPVTDEVFRIFQRFYAYDRGPLNATVLASTETEDWRQEKVAYQAGYGEERMFAYVFLPKRVPPRWQTVVIFPGANVLHVGSSEHFAESVTFGWMSYLVKTGRAMVFPIYKGTFERHDDLLSDHPATTNVYRDHVVMWSKELRRTIDYVETRSDLDAGKIAYYGFSWGGAMGAIMPAMEPRINVLVLESGGLYSETTFPEVDQINFARRIKVPVLMLNARFDHFFPLETSQVPMFGFFGAPAKDKRHIVLDGWHVLPRQPVVKEVLPWLDRYLGPANGPAAQK